jgi:Uma2 family endonuclease
MVCFPKPAAALKIQDNTNLLIYTTVMTTSGYIDRMTQERHRMVPRRATVAEWLAEPEENGAELIRGCIVYKAFPNPEHGRTQAKLTEALGPFNCRPGGAHRPGGWWIASEVDFLLNGEGFRPDICGWRRDRVHSLPKPGPQGAVTERPDWVAEILSTSTADRDLDEKLTSYHAAGIPHYWILDPASRILMIYRHSAEGYIFVRGAKAGTILRAEPFDALELSVGFLFGADDEEEPATAENP